MYTRPSNDQRPMQNGNHVFTVKKITLFVFALIHSSSLEGVPCTTCAPAAMIDTMDVLKIQNMNTVDSPSAHCRAAMDTSARTSCGVIPTTKRTGHRRRQHDFFATMAVHMLHVLSTYDPGPSRQCLHLLVASVCTECSHCSTQQPLQSGNAFALFHGSR